MPNRKEPQLNLNPAANNPATNQVRSEDSAPYHYSSSTAANSYNTSNQEDAPSSNFNLLGWLSLAISLTALALGIWLTLEVTAQPKKINQLVNRLEEIELELNNTGKSLNQTGNSFSNQLAQIKQQQELHFSEIDKLWGARKKSRLGIETLDKTTAQHTSQLKQQQTALTNTGNQIKQLENSSNSQLGELNLITSTLREDVTQLKQLNQQLASLKERLAKLEKSASTQELTNLKNQLTEQQEILRSLETSRNQLMQRLTKLDAELQELQN